MSTILNVKEKIALIKSIMISEKAFSEMTKEYAFLNDNYLKKDSERIRTRIAHYQFKIASLNSDFPFEFNEIKLSHGYIIPELITPKIKIHIARTQKGNCLPATANYKKEAAKNNLLLDNRLQLLNDQLQFDGCVDTLNSTENNDDMLYAVLCFGGQGSLDFIHLNFPDANFKKVVDSMPLVVSRDFSDELSMFKPEEITRESAKLRIFIKENQIL